MMVAEADNDGLKRLDELAVRRCRWPVERGTDQEWRFCGKKAAHGPYCKSHRRLAFSPSSSRASAAP